MRVKCIHRCRLALRCRSLSLRPAMTGAVGPGALAATLGFIIAEEGIATHAPAVLLASFIPMVLVALGYRYMNRADPDAGTTFAWTTRAFGPGFGWLNGWAIFLADLLVMASLAYIASTYTFKLFEWHLAETPTGAALGGAVL